MRTQRPRHANCTCILPHKARTLRLRTWAVNRTPRYGRLYFGGRTGGTVQYRWRGDRRNTQPTYVFSSSSSCLNICPPSSSLIKTAFLFSSFIGCMFSHFIPLSRLFWSTIQIVRANGSRALANGNKQTYLFFSHQWAKAFEGKRRIKNCQEDFWFCEGKNQENALCNCEGGLGYLAA